MNTEYEIKSQKRQKPDLRVWTGGPIELSLTLM